MHGAVNVKHNFDFLCMFSILPLGNWVNRGVYACFLTAAGVPERPSLFCRTCIACLVFNLLKLSWFVRTILVGHVIVYKIGALKSFNSMYASCFSAVPLGGVTLHYEYLSSQLCLLIEGKLNWPSAEETRIAHAVVSRFNCVTTLAN